MGVNPTNSNILFGVKIPIPGKAAVDTKFEIKQELGLVHNKKFLHYVILDRFSWK